MTALSTDDIDALHAQTMRNWSSSHTETPITKAQARALLVLIDVGLEGAESSIVSGLPAGPGKTWLVANAAIGRELMERVERRRKEVL